MFGSSGFSFGTGGSGAGQGASGNSGGGFSGFGGGGGSLFGAKSAAPGEEAKPAAAPSGNLFGSVSTAAASKPEAAKSSVPFSFGSAAGAPATPTPAPSMFGGGASSANTGGLFGAKPAANTSLFGSSMTTAPATSAAAAPAASTLGGFAGFGLSASSGLSLGGGATTTAETPASKSLFGATSAAPAAGGFQFGVPSLSSATTSAAAPAGSVAAAATDSKAAPFGLKLDAPAAANPTAGTGFGGFKLSTAPVVSGAGSSDGKMTGTSTPSLGVLGLGSQSAAAASASTSAAAASAGASGAGKIESATDLANAALRGKTMEEIAQMWTSELTVQTRAFHTQASTVSYWDRALVQQGKRITELYDATMAVEAEQAALDQSLEHMEGQQNALQNLLDAYEGRVQGIVRKTTSRTEGGKGAALSADEERDNVYSSAERLNMQLDELTRRLTTLVEDVNGISKTNAATNDAEGQRSQAADPFAQIVQILNEHLTSLEWVDAQTAQLQDRVKNAQRVYQDVNAAQTSIAGAYGGGAPADDPYGANYADSDGHRDNPRLTIPGAFGGEPSPPVTSSFGTPMATARKPLTSSLLGRGSGSANVPPASPFGSTPLRRGF